MCEEKTNLGKIIFLRQEPAEIPHSRTGIYNNNQSSVCPDLKACGVSAVAQGGGSRRRNGPPATPDSDSHASFSFSPAYLYHKIQFRAAFNSPGSVEVFPSQIFQEERKRQTFAICLNGFATFRAPSTRLGVKGTTGMPLFKSFIQRCVGDIPPACWEKSIEFQISLLKAL